MVQVLAPVRAAEVAHAREVDTQVAALWDVYWQVMKAAAVVEQRVENAQRMVDYYPEGSPSHAGAVEKLAQRQAEMDAKRAEAHEAAKVARDFDAANYGGWQRFFLVKHIHASQHCSSFRFGTRIGWLPDVSGLTEGEAVAEHGAILCTICFPSAPVEYTKGPDADPSLCSGSGKYHSTEHLTGREHAYVSPSGYCPDCLRWNSITKSGAMRKHKVDETKRHATQSMKAS